MVVEAKALQEALTKNKTFILNNLETITLKQLRNRVEQELGLKKDDLKPEKNVIGAYVDKLIAEKAAAEKAAKKAAEQQNKKQEKQEDVPEDSDSDADEKPKKKQKAKPAPAPKAAPRVYSKRVDNLRKICRQATITVPPNIYVKNKTDKELEAALVALLDKNGLDEHAGANEIAKVKQKLQIQRDLEGIDTSNIIKDGPRSRRRGVEKTSYKELLKDAVHSEEEEEEEDQGDSDDGEDSDSGDGKEESDVSEGQVGEPSASEDDDGERIPPSKRGSGSDEAEIEPLKEIPGNMPQAAKRQRVVDWSDDDDE